MLFACGTKTLVLNREGSRQHIESFLMMNVNHHLSSYGTHSMYTVSPRVIRAESSAG
jgi:hypothetical protein